MYQWSSGAGSSNALAEDGAKLGLWRPSERYEVGLHLGCRDEAKDAAKWWY